MNTKEIHQGNKLIAKFMGGEFNRTHTAVTTKHGFNSIGALKYHTSWDWIMEVVKKINDLNFTNNHNADLSRIGMLNFIGHEAKQANITGVFEEVIKFIEWYNERIGNDG